MAVGFLDATTMGPQWSLRRYLRWVKPFLPDAEHPAASQPTPYGLNRYVLLVIYIFYVVVTACDYLGWGPLSAILFRAGAFLWLCTEEEQISAEAARGHACLNQVRKIQDLFSFCYAAHFLTTAVAGFLIDLAGPKVTALLGSSITMCGWALLGACSEYFTAWFPAFVMLGAGAGMTYVPMLSIVNLFPGSLGFSMTMMGAASSLSLAVPSLLNSASLSGMSFKWVCWSYAVCGPFVGLLIVSMFLPLDGFIEVDFFVLVRTMHSPRASAIGPNDQQQEFAEHQSVTVNWLPSRRSRAMDHAALSTVTDDDYFQPFRKEACTFLYVGICLYFAICSFSVVYYRKIASLFLAKEAFNAMDIATPLSTIPCIILGRV